MWEVLEVLLVLEDMAEGLHHLNSGNGLVRYTELLNGCLSDVINIVLCEEAHTLAALHHYSTGLHAALQSVARSSTSEVKKLLFELKLGLSTLHELREY